MGRHSNSTNIESGVKQHSNSLNAAVEPERVQSQDVASDKYKNYKGGKLSQEFYYKTLTLANNTMDRKDLNSSILQKQQKPNDISQRETKSGNGSAVAVVSTKESVRSNTNSFGNSFYNPSQISASEITVQGAKTTTNKKVQNTFAESLVKKLELRKGEKDKDTAVPMASRPPLQRSTNHNHSQTQPIQQKKPDSAIPLEFVQDIKPLKMQHIGSTQQAPVSLKERRSNSFYQEKKISGRSDDNQSSISVDMKKPTTPAPLASGQKKTSSGTIGDYNKKKRVAGKVFNFLDNIKKNENQLPPFESSKTVVKDFDHIKAFSVNTHQGTVRAYNEDRVSILLNAQQR